MASAYWLYIVYVFIEGWDVLAEKPISAKLKILPIQLF